GRPGGDDDREEGGGGGDALALVIPDDLARKDLVAEPLRHGGGHLGRPRIVAGDHQRPQRDGAREGPARGRLVERRRRAEGIAIELTHLSSPFVSCIYTLAATGGPGPGGRLRTFR